MSARFDASQLLVPVVAFSVSIGFVLQTVLMADVSDQMLVAAPLLVVASVALVWAGPLRVTGALNAAPKMAALGALGGVLAFWAAPLLVLLQRATDAPPGSETLFFTTSVWGLIACVVGVIAGRVRQWPLVISAAIAGAVAGATILANWERPSSFSPFVRFPVQGWMMIVAGLLFAVGTALLLYACRRGSRPPIIALGICAAAIVSIPLALAAGDSLITLTRVWPSLLLLGVVQAVFVFSWVPLADRRGIAAASPGFLLVPAAVTSFSAIERVTGVWGADPIQWPAVIAASAVLIASVVVIAAGGRIAGSVPSPSAERLGRVALVAAGAGVLGTAVSMGLPALQASSRGVGPAGDRFEADWLLVGAESAEGWMALAAALLVLSAAYVWRERMSTRVVVLGVVAAFTAAASLLYLGRTSFYTHTRWIPAEVQQAYGTEYARIWMEPVFEPVRVVSVVVAVAAGVLLLASVVLAGGGRTSTRTGEV